MLKNCPQCGAANRERANDCYVCESPLPPMGDAPEPEISVADNLARDILDHIPAPEPATTPAPAEPVAARANVTEMRPGAARAAAQVAVADVPPSEPEWKREVAHRLEEYRSKQRNAQAPQPGLPFEAPAEPDAVQEPHPRESLRVTARSKPPSAERLEISTQPELDFEAPPAAAEQPNSHLVPVAEIGERLHAGLLDAGFVAIAYGGFLLMFNSLGGEFSLGRVAVLVYVATGFLIYAQYFALFTAFGGSTPGMLVRGLHVVGFDGNAPTQRQLLWRSFGYLVSAAAALLGFFWALWDEDQLTWQDRISQTYVTAAPHESFSLTGSSSMGGSSFTGSSLTGQSWRL